MQATVICASHPRPPADDSGWLLYHSVGRCPDHQARLAAALTGAAAMWAGDLHWEQGMRQRQRVIQLWGDLIGAEAGTIFAAENVTLAFDAFVSALPPEALRGRKVLIAADCFPSLHFLFSGLAPRLGFELVTVAAREQTPYVTDEDFIAAWDERIALAVITWVTSTASKRANLPRLIAHGRNKGSLITVDITQGIGLLPFSVQNVDFATSTCLKWLCGMPGAGLGYIAPHLIPSLQPRIRGWCSQPPPLNWDIDHFTFADDARRFGHGTPSFLPYSGSIPGLEWISAQDRGEVAQHNQLLCRQLIDIAAAHGLTMITPKQPDERGGTVVIQFTDENETELVRQGLLACGLRGDRRGRRLRLSPGPVTTAAAVGYLDEVLPRVLVNAGRGSSI